MSVQEAEISEQKSKAIEMKPEMDADDPSPHRKPTKRGLASDSIDLFRSPKKFFAMAIEDLPTPDKETGNWAHFTVALVAGA